MDLFRATFSLIFLYLRLHGEMKSDRAEAALVEAAAPPNHVRNQSLAPAMLLLFPWFQCCAG